MVEILLALLLLISGDIETNPGPVSEFSLVLCKTVHHTDVMSHSPLAGQKLSVDDLPVVREELNKVRAKWYDVGMQLGVSVDTLNAIRKQHLNDPSDCLREILTTWLKAYHPPPTWDKLLKVLKTKTVDEAMLAADLECKYCLSKPVSPTSVPASLTTPNLSTPFAIATMPSSSHTIDCPTSSPEMPAQPLTPPHHPALEERTGMLLVRDMLVSMICHLSGCLVATM